MNNVEKSDYYISRNTEISVSLLIARHFLLPVSFKMHSSRKQQNNSLCLQLNNTLQFHNSIKNMTVLRGVVNKLQVCSKIS